MSDGTEPIDEGEVLYRRIPVSQKWYDRNVSPRPAPEAFLPNTADADGISLTREKYETPEQVGASGRVGRQFYVAAFRAKTLLKDIGMNAKPDGDEAHPGHAIVPGMHRAARNSAAVQSAAKKLSESCLEIYGPFDGQTQVT